MGKLFEDDEFSALVELKYYQREREKLIIEQAQLEAAFYKYISFFNLASTGYFCLNKQGLITNVNQAGENLLEIHKDFLINRCFSRFISPESQIIFSQHRRSAQNKLSPKPLEIIVLKKNGSFFHAKCESKFIINIDTGEEELLVMINDITESKLIEQNMELATIICLRLLSFKNEGNIMTSY